MPAKQKLRILGSAVALTAGLGLSVTVPLTFIFNEVQPLRTIGVHGMLPENFHSLVFGVIFTVASGVLAAMLVLGLLCYFAERVAEVTAIAMGSLLLLEPLVTDPATGVPLAVHLASGPWSFFPAYFLSLGLSARHERKPFEAAMVRDVVTRPALLALGLALLVTVLRGVLGVLWFARRH